MQISSHIYFIKVIDNIDTCIYVCDTLQKLMYSDPSRYAFLFQSYVQLTMLQLHTCKIPSPYKIMERSVYSAMCFIENMKRTNILRDIEVNILEEWYDWSIKNTAINTNLIGTYNLMHLMRNNYKYMLSLCIYLFISFLGDSVLENNT